MSSSYSGPSKEELDYYFKNSRQYFDQLAEHYRKSEPDYYNEFIAPYYSNPFLAGKGGKGCAGRSLGLSFSILMITLAAGLVFFFLDEDKDNDNDNEDNTEIVSDNNNEINNNDFRVARKQADSLLTLRYNDKDTSYINFETRVINKLKSIKSSDKDYENAQELIKEIREHRIQKNKRNR